MVILDLYKKLNVSTIDEIQKIFLDTLLITNRQPDFYVDWKKVNEQAKEIGSELDILNTLFKSETIEDDFIAMIRENPEVLRALPRVIAERELDLPMVFDLFTKNPKVKYLDFEQTMKSSLDKRQISEFMRFSRESGILELLNSVKNIHDYLLGVEVGMDTNARKNRSGKLMEQVVEPYIQRACKSVGCNYLRQKKYNAVRHLKEVPSSLKDRRADFIVYSGTSFVGIEVNFYSKPGSKPQEIVDAYIHRMDELKEKNWNFIWITDGGNWSTLGSQLQKGFDTFDCILNIKLMRMGLLEDALKEFLQ